jgi:hypothetical protein
MLFMFVMELQLACVPNDPIHVAGFGGEDFGALELDVMVMVKSMLSYSALVWLSKWAVLVVVFHPGHSGQPVCPV